MIVRRAGAAGAVAAGVGAVLGGRPLGLWRMVRGVRSGGRSLAGVLAGAAARCPDAVALVDQAGPVTARELDHAADDVAREVRDAWSGQGAVGVKVGDHRGFVAAVAGVLRAGADAVLIGPRTGADVLAPVIADQRIVLLISDGPPGPTGPGPLVLEPTDTGAAADPPTAGTDPLPRGAPGAGQSREPRVVMLTAGTTGPPTVAAPTARGITTERLLTQLGLLGVCGIRRGRPVLVLTPLFHGHGYAFLAAGLLIGGPVVLAGARTGAQVCAAVARHDVGVVTGVPVHLRRLAEHLSTEHTDPAGGGGGRCPHVPAPDRVVSGSDRLPNDLVDTLTTHLGEVVVDLFGSTQTGVLTAATPRDRRAAPGTVGRPVPGARLAVLDDDGRRCRAGAEGNVALMVGRSGPGRAVLSGDRGVFDRAGRLHLLGRTDGVVVCGGENVRPADVLAVLEAQPGVDSASVGPVPDAEYGTRLIADVVLVPEGPLPAAEAPGVLRDAVRAGIGPHAVPRTVRVVDALRRSAVGKPLPPVAPAVPAGPE